MYNPVQVVVACSQREKLKSQIQQKYLPIKIDLKSTTPTDTLLLTHGQVAAIEKVRTLGKRKFKTIRMSQKQIDKNRSYQGGYLSILNSDKQDDDDTTIDASDDGLYLFKNGHCMRVYPVQDNGFHLKEHFLYLQEHSGNTFNDVSNDGLYSKQNNIIENGEKIIFAENSQFQVFLHPSHSEKKIWMFLD